MFRKNTQHQQPALISAIQDLPAKQRERLEQSWAGTFYGEFFCRIEEERFAVLYSDQPSRPNVPVNVLVGLDAIKAGLGWSDEELYEAFLYNLQVRYALGYDRLGEGEFEIRTLYYFRQRLSAYNLKHGVNLLEAAFEQITDQQIVELKVRTGMQRMDSTQIASNILDASRLHLVLEGIQRLHRLLGELKVAYEKQEVYQVVERLFGENFHVVEAGVRVKENQELPSGSLQSLDDLEATYRFRHNPLQRLCRQCHRNL